MIDWIVKNWSYILSGFCGLIIVCSVIVKLTPNEKDNKILDKVIGILDHFSIVKTARDKEMIEIAKEIKK